MPRKDDSTNAQECGQHDVRPPADGFAIERGILGGHDGGGNEEGDSGVIDASEAFHKSLLGDAAHCMPEAAADEALAGREEKCCCEKDICLG